MKSFKIDDKNDWQEAGANDLIELIPPAGHPLFYRKRDLHIICITIVNGGRLHISGASGSGKTSLIEALCAVPENWRWLCQHNDLEFKPLSMFHLAASNFESPNEVWYRRAINSKGTYDEIQKLIVFVTYAIKHIGKAYFSINLVEAGRMKPVIQHSLVNLMTRGTIIDPLTGDAIGLGEGIAYIADSNYAAADQHDFLLVDLDTAFENRLNETGIVLDHLSQEEEFLVLRRMRSSIGAEQVSDEIIEKITQLGSMIRDEQLCNGALTSISPVSMRQYRSFLQLAAKSNLPPEDLVDITLFALANAEDRETANELKSYVFGIDRDAYADSEYDEIPY